MKRGFSALIILIVAVVLISSCSQPAKKSADTTGEARIETPVKTTNTPSPTEISISGDSLGTELARSDMIDNDLQDTEFEGISSDLSEIESGL